MRPSPRFFWMWVLPVLALSTHRTTVTVMLAQNISTEVASWKHDSFEDFRRGTPGNSGHNLFVTHDGQVRTIRRFDLNQDGHLDLVFNSTHDWQHYIPATLVSVSPDRRPEQADIDVLGSSRVIVRDLNRDGRLDLFFHPNRQNLQHERTFLTVMWGGDRGWSADRATRQLPVHGSTSAAVVDLNRDEWPDLVALNGEAWLPQQPAGRILRVYWGSAEGFQLFRFLDIGAPDALEIAAGDFDGDRADDLAVVDARGSLKILWSTPGADKPNAFQPTEIPLLPGAASGGMSVTRAGAVKSGGSIQTMNAGDLNGDGPAEIVVATRARELLVVGFDGRRPRSPLSVPAFGASHLTIADADRDGHQDLILTDLTLAQSKGGEAAGARADSADPIVILWGDRDGFSRERSTSLAIPQAIATAVGDYDGDGKADIAVAVHQGAETTTAESKILFNEGNRRFRRDGASVSTHGAMHPATIPATRVGGNAGAPTADRVIFCNSLRGTIGEAVPLYIYWGDTVGFNVDRLWKMPFRAGYKSLGADLRGSGHVDLVTLNSGHGLQSGEYDPEMGAHIYWGGDTGVAGGPNRFDLGRRIVLNEPDLGSSNVADFNRDGYLDLVLGAFESDKPKAELVIYYGAPAGFSKATRFSLENDDRSFGCLVADFDRDGWLDIGVMGFVTNKVTLYHGSPEGFSATRRKDMLVPAPIDLETADLNQDGWLDLIVGSYWDPVAHHHDAGFTIFWGGREGFTPWRAQWLPGWTPIGLAVADIDGDGHLDIVSPHYHAEITREDVPSYIYWGDRNGYSVQKRTSLTVDSAHDVMVADFNGDQLPDLAFSAHSRNEGHRTSSPIYLNDGKRFAHPDVQYLPTIGTHFMYVQDIGNIADRRLVETYESPSLTWNAAARRGRLQSDAELPSGTRLEFHVRSAATESALDSVAWRNVAQGAFDVESNDRVLQYRALFLSPNGDRFPLLKSIAVSVSP